MVSRLLTRADIAFYLSVKFEHEVTAGALGNWLATKDTPTEDFYIANGKEWRLWREERLPEWYEWYRHFLETRNDSQVRRVWKR